MRAIVFVFSSLLLMSLLVARASPADGGRPAAADGGASDVGATPIVERPRRRSMVHPYYPPEWRAAGVVGDVSVMITIDTSGYVTSVKIIKESPFPQLNESARKEAATERFDPAKRDGRPISYCLSFTYHFRADK